jgi:hypothetical protein
LGWFWGLRLAVYRSQLRRRKRKEEREEREGEEEANAETRRTLRFAEKTFCLSRIGTERKLVYRWQFSACSSGEEEEREEEEEEEEGEEEEEEDEED